MKLWKQIKYYERLLKCFLALNVLLVLSGAVLISFYFSTSYSSEKKLSTALNSIGRLSELENDLNLLEKKQEWQGRDWIALGEWSQSYAGLTGIRPLGHESLFIPNKKPDLSLLKVSLNKEKALQLEQLVQLKERQGRYRSEIIWIALGSLLFGFLLPSLILRRLHQRSLQLKQKLEDEVVQSLQVWRSALHQKKNQGLKSPELWIEISLMTLHRASSWWDHPLASFLQELSLRLSGEFVKLDSGREEASTVKEHAS